MNKNRKILKEDKAEEYRDREEEQVLNDEERPIPNPTGFINFFLHMKHLPFKLLGQLFSGGGIIVNNFLFSKVEFEYFNIK